MKLEVWIRNGKIYKHPREIEKLKIGLHTHLGDGKTYMSVEIDKKELMFNVTLVSVTPNPEDEFPDDMGDSPYTREYPTKAIRPKE